GLIAAESAGRVKVTDGYGQRIACIQWFGCSVEFEQPHDHTLYLEFVRLAITHYRGLDCQGRVLGDLQTGVRGRQHSHTAHLAELERGLGVHRVEDFFDGNHTGRVREDDFLQFFKDLSQTNGKALLLIESNRSCGYEAQVVP